MEIYLKLTFWYEQAMIVLWLFTISRIDFISKLLVDIKNIRGPNTEPWGTPRLISDFVNLSDLTKWCFNDV